MTQTWWLSFTDADRPPGQRFLGVVIVDVTDAAARAANRMLEARRAANDLAPGADDRAAWIAAAIFLTHHRGCNPGGETLAVRLDEAPEFVTYDALLPRNKLLSGPELEALGIGQLASLDDLEQMSEKESETHD